MLSKYKNKKILLLQNGSEKNTHSLQTNMLPTAWSKEFTNQSSVSYLGLYYNSCKDFRL